MDKKTVLLASACTLLMISCSNDSELINVAETTGLQTKAFVGEADFQIVDYAGDKCIQFKNDSVFNAMLWEMNDMSEEEINNIFSGVGFVSQWQLMQEADQEQELIVDNYEKDLSQPWYPAAGAQRPAEPGTADRHAGDGHGAPLSAGAGGPGVRPAGLPAGRVRRAAAEPDATAGAGRGAGRRAAWPDQRLCKDGAGEIQARRRAVSAWPAPVRSAGASEAYGRPRRSPTPCI